MKVADDDTQYGGNVRHNFWSLKSFNKLAFSVRTREGKCFNISNTKNTIDRGEWMLRLVYLYLFLSLYLI